MRYGFFFGPGTWYTSAGDMGEQVRRQQVPIRAVGIDLRPISISYFVFTDPFGPLELGMDCLTL